jgi:hypothetical protein
MAAVSQFTEGAFLTILETDMFIWGKQRVTSVARMLTRSASAPSFGVDMTALLIILLVTIGLSVRAGLYGRRWNVADSDTQEDFTPADTYARTFILVLLSLLGLFALGVMYGNVLGHASR